jgi:hypothetical protein
MFTLLDVTFTVAVTPPSRLTICGVEPNEKRPSPLSAACRTPLPSTLSIDSHMMLAAPMSVDCIKDKV